LIPKFNPSHLSGIGLTIFKSRIKISASEIDSSGAAMGTATRSDPELLSIGRPRCLKCNTGMITAEVSAGPEGFERRTFECLKCGDTDSKVIPCDSPQV
jgi:hypothetical protein